MTVTPPLLTVEDLQVRFRSGGLRELAWHLVTWRDAIEIAAWGLPRSGHCHREPGSACSLLACGFAWGCEP